jgi:hypothetical protein
MRKVVFFIVLFFLIISLVRNVFDYQRNLSFYSQTKENFEKAFTQNKQLKVHKQTSTSPFEVEKSLRNKQNMLRKDEIIVIVPSPSPLPTPIILPTVPPQRQWMRLFFSF